jgi:hypothetical protein
MAGKSEWKKDYGMYILNQIPDKTKTPEFNYPNFTFYNLAVLEPGLYTTTVDVPGFDGEIYAMTIDFDETLYQKILNNIPGHISSKLMDLVDRVVDYPAMIRFEQGISVGLTVRLGQTEHGSSEDFIPFIGVDVI